MTAHERRAIERIQREKDRQIEMRDRRIERQDRIIEAMRKRVVREQEPTTDDGWRP